VLFRRPVQVFAWFAALAGAAASSDLRAQEQDVGPARDAAAVGVHRRPADKDAGTNPLRGSTLLFEQSMTTQTTQVQPSAEQSYVPLYELWLSLRPRYYFDEHFSVRARFDYTKELTNSQSTTFYREDVFGDAWTDLVYSTAADSFWEGTKANVGIRALWPISKASQANGTYVSLGAVAGATHKFELRGPDASTFSDFHVGLSVTYLHPITGATTATSYGGFQLQDVGDYDHSIITDQIRGSTNVEHNLWIIADTGVAITPKLSMTVAGLLINQWHYAPTNQGVPTATGTANPSLAGDVTYTPNTWFIADLDYALFDELNLSLGYYNLAGEIAPDGHRRGIFGSDNVFWSPYARVFFDVTMNLDAVFDDAVHHRYSRQSALEQGEERRAKHVSGI
jgi:hypothetical protein